MCAKRLCGIVLPVCMTGLSCFAQPAISLINLKDPNAASCVTAIDADFKCENDRLAVYTRTNKEWPGITIKPVGGFWNLKGFLEITAEIRNLSSENLQLFLRVDNPGADGSNNCLTDSIQIDPGKTATLPVRLYSSPWILDESTELVGMRGYPDSSKLDTEKINQILFFVNHPKMDYQFEIAAIQARGKVTILKKETFFPFIDTYGQFTHTDWPGKIHSQADLTTDIEKEAKDLTDNPLTTDWDKWGGWTKKGKQKATGFFRTEKLDGQWWLVDPDGNLFWSHGVDCVGTQASTPITGREKYFQWLPGDNPEWKSCWSKSNWAPVGYYKDKGEYQTFDFAQANLIRKYGTDWFDVHAELCHKRLNSWAMNTIGNWSDRTICLLSKTPYTATLGTRSRPIEGSEGYWGKFPDPFDASFAESIRSAVEREKDKSINNPWCLGFFVDNELSWGEDTSLALGALTSPADQPAKIKYARWLTDKYKTIEQLNQAWNSTYESWYDLLKSQKQPDAQKAEADLKAFYTVIAECYFETISKALKTAAPNQLYMGCRFAWANELAIRAANKYCDVISFNKYEYSIANLNLPAGIDKPIIIGEFHFGALDRGMFHTGLKPTKNQADRALKYKEYVLGALRNPYIVGTHWFQFRDQATTGRGDGENYQIGLVDICDTPYPETINAIRDVGKSMYEYRYETGKIK